MYDRVGPALRNGHLQRLDYQLCAQVCRHRPAHGTPDTLPISKTFLTSRPSLVRRIPSKANGSRS